MINQHEWLRTRKNLLDQVKSQVQVRLGPLSPALKRYAKELEREFTGVWRACAEGEFRGALGRAAVILGADFHAYSQSQRAHIRMLRDHIQSENVILALECLPAGQEANAHDFLAGRISERKFLELTDWENTWGFPWEHYRPLFELARDRGYNVLGLNNPKLGSLPKRDTWTAKRLLQARRQSPGALLYVVIGEWHLAAQHLPKRLKSSLSGRDEMLILYQDVERLFFKRELQRKTTGDDFLKGPGNRYCLMVSPPWMKWQSYLMYLEHAYDRDLQEEIAIDYSDHVVSLIELLQSDLKIQTKTSRVQVYSPTSKTPLARLRLSLPKKYDRSLVYHLEHDLSFFIPEKDWLYLSRATINHASSLAGQFVHAHLCMRQRTLWNVPEDFLSLVWTEAIGFFFSKWINPKRKADTLESLRLQLEARQPRDSGRAALLLALDHRLSEVVYVQTGRLRRARFQPRGPAAYIEASRMVGSMLGERLFQKVRSRTISLAQLMSYLKLSVDGKDFTKFYWQLIRELEHDQSL